MMLDRDNKADRFETIESMVVDASEIIEPIERLSVSESAERYRKLNNVGSYVGDWKNNKAPYLIEPMDELASNEYTGWVFVGPARCGKSDMFFNWLTYTQKCDPADMQFVAMTQSVAREWSQKDLARFFRATEECGKRVLPGKQNRNVFDVKFRGGTELLIRWPSITELSGKTMQRGWFADYDRMPQDIDGEGPPFGLGRKRAESYRSYGMWCAESSPGFEVEDPKARLPSLHYAPPAKGILSLYNTGDRRRLYWRCLLCKQPFQPRFECFAYPNSKDISEAAEMTTLRCPNPSCMFDMTFNMRPEMSEKGRWVKDGMVWMPDGRIVGTPPRTDVCSFWMFGPAAIFQNWGKIVYEYLSAKRIYDTTGDLGPLRVTTNVDQGEPFIPPTVREARTPEWLAQRQEDWGGTAEEPVVPAGVLFLIATVDVQAGSRSSFVVQVHGQHKNRDVSFVDMFKIRVSERKDPYTGENAIVDPGGYFEDWFLLIKNVICRTYPLADDSGRRMAILYTGCDMGGAEGVAANAYNFWRYLRDNPNSADPQIPHGLENKFTLIRGEPKKTHPTCRVHFPDSGRKDRNSGARGDVPVTSLNSNLLKDQIDAMLNRREEGGGYVRFPKWAPPWLYTQLTGEVRDASGWKNLRQRKNEAWDLFYYFMGLLHHPSIDFYNINWEHPPHYALDWSMNDLVFGSDEKAPFDRSQEITYNLAEIAKQLA